MIEIPGNEQDPEQDPEQTPTHHLIEWEYPNIYLPPGERSTLEISLCHVRAAYSIRVSYDSDRDGWLIEQAITYHGGYPPEGMSSDTVWEEVAFVKAWAKERRSICGRRHVDKQDCSAPFHEEEV